MERTPGDDAATVLIDPRYNGPPTTANGGYAAGLLAAHVGTAAVEVTLRSPPPLARPLGLDRREDAVVVLHDDDRVVAEARPGVLDLEVPGAVSLDAARRAAARSPAWSSHPFATCFVCGPQRPDGLRIFAGPVDDTVVAAPWEPAAVLASRGGAVRPEFVWAALDCPGAFSFAWWTDPPFVLGRLTVQRLEPVPADRPVIALGWQLAADGRKRTVGSALLGVDGTVLALARARWIQPRR